MARGFGTTLGSATTDRIVSALTSHPTQRSYSLWTYRNGDGGNSSGRMFQKGSSVSLFNSGTTYLFQHAFSGDDGNWTITRPAASEWHHLGIAYDAGAVGNNPVIYVDGSSVSVNETLAPTGTLTTDAIGYTFGNRAGNDRNWDGILAWAAIWDALLGDDELAALGKGVCPLVIRPMSLVEFLPWAGSTTHSWVAGAPTVVGTAVQPDGFTHYYPARRRSPIIAGAPAAADVLMGQACM